ncbi:MAG: DsbA family protein, partial [Halobacteria archaeon]|nr:DsbA family protein [Halobacteria archaeon]
VLADIGDDVGICPEEVREAVEDDGLRDSLFGMFEEARREGVTGVPTFVYGEHVSRGAVPPEQLRRLVEGVAADSG